MNSLNVKEEREGPKEKIQKIMNKLGAVINVNYAFLLSKTGAPLVIARTTPFQILKEFPPAITKLIKTTMD